MHLRLVDTDGSITRQPGLAALRPWRSCEVVPLADLGPRLRLWSRRTAVDSARRRLRDARPTDDAPTVSLLGSGDFHHLAALLIEAHAAPVTVLHFDNHPDWVRLAPRWHCGSWVNRALALPHVERVITVGPCSSDLAWPELKGGNLDALSSGRLVLFPWRHPPSRVLLKRSDGPGHVYDQGRLLWRNLSDHYVDDAWDTVCAAILTEAIWISVDKDVLSADDAVTNWDQGEMSLRSLLAAIRTLGQRHRIVGADICGDYSPPRHRHWLKRFEARMDQPRATAPADVDARNAETNRALLAALFEAST